MIIHCPSLSYSHLHLDWSISGHVPNPHHVLLSRYFFAKNETSNFSFVWVLLAASNSAPLTFYFLAAENDSQFLNLSKSLKWPYTSVNLLCSSSSIHSCSFLARLTSHDTTAPRFLFALVSSLTSCCCCCCWPSCTHQQRLHLGAAFLVAPLFYSMASWLSGSRLETGDRSFSAVLRLLEYSPTYEKIQSQ